ncbi:hypothetical protein F5887DRAFT_882354 [Amanita rubescens]|nr:hypothetical protein F5887DRAFT_882354 [Amanita rubescens]
MHATISAKVHTLLSKVKILTSLQKQEERIAALQAEIETLQRELGEGVDAEAIVKRQINLLHRYNEAKDATQVRVHIVHPAHTSTTFAWQLATIKQTTVRQIHNDMDLKDTD